MTGAEASSAQAPPTDLGRFPTLVVAEASILTLVMMLVSAGPRVGVVE